MALLHSAVSQLYSPPQEQLENRDIRLFLVCPQRSRLGRRQMWCCHAQFNRNKAPKGYLQRLCRTLESQDDPPVSARTS